MNFVLFWTGSGSPGQTTDQEPLDYCLLCAVLLFLADLDDGIPFLLSSLTQAVETFLSKVQPVDWTRFPHRKSLVRVLQYAQEVGLVLVYDGNKNLDQFLTGELQLYRNGAFFLLSEGERCGALFGNGWGAQLRACSSERIPGADRLYGRLDAPEGAGGGHTALPSRGQIGGELPRRLSK